MLIPSDYYKELEWIIQPNFTPVDVDWPYFSIPILILLGWKLSQVVFRNLSQ